MARRTERQRRAVRAATGPGRRASRMRPNRAPGRPDPFKTLEKEHASLRTEIQALQGESGGHPIEARAASRRLADFAARHFRREEKVLYPLCERLFGRDGAVSVMRGDHASIRKALKSIVASGGAPRVSDLDPLVELLEGHFGREERVLFPIMAALLSGTEMERLARSVGSGPDIGAIEAAKRVPTSHEAREGGRQA